MLEFKVQSSKSKTHSCSAFSVKGSVETSSLCEPLWSSFRCIWI